MVEIIETDEISKVEKLRLAILFALRYENDNLIFQLKEKMKTQGFSEEQLKLIGCMLEYAGKGKRTSNLYNDGDLLSKGKKLFSNMFSEV